MEKLNELIERKTSLEKRRERLIGKLEESRRSLSLLDSKLEERGIDPDSLDSEIERMQIEYNKYCEDLRHTLNEADSILTKIEERINKR